MRVLPGAELHERSEGSEVQRRGGFAGRRERGWTSGEHFGAEEGRLRIGRECHRNGEKLAIPAGEWAGRESGADGGSDRGIVPD